LNHTIDTPFVNKIDVTLRDGGFLCNFAWPREFYCDFISKLDIIKTPFIEIGYLGGIPELHNVTKVGFATNISIEEVARCSEHLQTSSIILMVHPGSLSSIPDFKAYKRAGLKGVRFVYHSSWRDKLTPLFSAAQDAELLTTFNIALVSKLNTEEFKNTVCWAKTLSPSVIYLADTCSALGPNEVISLITEVKDLVLDIPIGFHAHDFLNLALANTLAAAKAGASYIDSSFNGLGRGAGNLISERWLLLEMIKQRSFDREILKTIDETSTLVKNLNYKAATDNLSLISAALNMSPPEEDKLRNDFKSNSDDLFLLLGRVILSKAKF
jgi:4-hydroxy 2-oxovalerate aldolase